MRKATLTLLATLIVAVTMALSAGSALAGWGWEDTNNGNSGVVTKSKDTGKGPWSDSGNQTGSGKHK